MMPPFRWVGVGAKDAERVVLPGVRTCSPLEEGILHLWTGGGGCPRVALGVQGGGGCSNFLGG